MPSPRKTTLLNALSAYLPARDRVVLIEDTAELQIERPNLVRFKARREQPGFPAVAIRDLLRATLRHRPDRIIVGEVRGGEAFDLLQALNTGHSGRCARDARLFRERQHRDVSPPPCDAVPRVRGAPPLSGDGLPLLWTSGSPSCECFVRRVCPTLRMARE